MKNKVIVILLLLAVVVLTIIPFMVTRDDASFGGTDDAAGTVIESYEPTYEPWATPLIEKIIGKELPGETESLLFCLQTGIGSGVLCFGFGYLVARKRYEK